MRRRRVLLLVVGVASAGLAIVLTSTLRPPPRGGTSGKLTPPASAGAQRATSLRIAGHGIPRFTVPRFGTYGSYPNVVGGPRSTAINNALRLAILRDQDRNAPALGKVVSWNEPKGARGLYRTEFEPRLVSASSVVVSTLIPETIVPPGGSYWSLWISATVDVRSGRLVSLRELLRDPTTTLPALAKAWTAEARKAGLGPAIAHIFGKHSPTITADQAFALLPHGFAFGFTDGPPGSRIYAVIPYRTADRYLSPLGLRLARGVRKPSVVQG